MAGFRERLKYILFPGTMKRTTDEGLRKTFADLIGVSEAGICVNEETALKMSAVWSCIRLLSELPASLPIEVYRETGRSREAIDHPVKSLLLNPTVLMNRFTWHELMNAYLQGWGNAVAIIRSDDYYGLPYQLIPVHPSSVAVVVSDGQVFYKINDYDQKIHGTFFASEVVHYKMFSTNGLMGKSPIRIARDNIALGLAAEQFGNKFFARGGNLKAVIESEGHMSDKEFVEWKARWEKFYSGPVGDHTTPILEYGLKYKQLGIPPENAQFIATRTFQIQEIARIFNVPPHMIADLSRSTFSNIEHQDIQFVKYTLRPILRRQEMELEDKLLTPDEKGVIRIRFNLDGLLRGDLATQTTHLREMVLSGIMVPNEARGILNLNPLPGLDKPYVPANIVGNNKPEDQPGNEDPESNNDKPDDDAKDDHLRNKA